jgi:hypothetical protein
MGSCGRLCGSSGPEILDVVRRSPARSWTPMLARLAPLVPTDVVYEGSEIPA